jgi:CxxC-x17-CxxC domain-containing protein
VDKAYSTEYKRKLLSFYVYRAMEATNMHRSDQGHRSHQDREDREMHKVTCSTCGEEAEVPFKPTEGKPVYCKDCYRKQKRY